MRNFDPYFILPLTVSIVAGEKIKPDTWYTCIGGKFVEST